MDIFLIKCTKLDYDCVLIETFHYFKGHYKVLKNIKG